MAKRRRSPSKTKRAASLPPLLEGGEESLDAVYACVRGLVKALGRAGLLKVCVPAAYGGERDKLDKEREQLTLLLGSEQRQRTRMKKDLGKIRDRYGPETALGARRTLIEEAAPTRDIPLEAMIEREPITVILSQRGWIRAMKGHATEIGRAHV
mgnify:CR=1 FL=1